jgi:hypothetical protein
MTKNWRATPIRRSYLIVIPIFLFLGLTSLSAKAERLELGLSLPVIVPLGYTPNVGVGAVSGLQYNLTPRWGFNVTSGILYTSGEEDSETAVPVLAGVSYVVYMGNLSSVDLHNYLSMRLGYTHAVDSDHSRHNLTGTAGGGLLFGKAGGFKIDFGVDLVFPDIRGNVDYPVRILMRIGVLHALI